MRAVLDDGADCFAFFPTKGEEEGVVAFVYVCCCHGNQSFLVGVPC